MIHLCGPRQVGKTTIAKIIQKSEASSIYRTWDSPDDRMRMLSLNYEKVLDGITLSPATHPLIIFDEIHKFPQWKNYLKGLYDLHHSQMKILVTGSARLNVFYKSGDSLMGRYLLYRVHPLTIGELGERSFDIFQRPKEVSDKTIQHLLYFGGFPEPFSKGSDRFRNQWQHLRQQQLIYEDIRSLEAIQDLSKLELLATVLQYQSSSLLNYTALSKKIKASSPTIQRWISVLEQVYFCYTIQPWSKNIARSLLKEPKVYLWDWSQCPEQGARYENFVSSHLLKATHYWTDNGIGTFELYFIRTKDKKEIDFLVTKNDQPWMLIEVKSSSSASLNKELHIMKEQLNCPFAFQVVFDLPSNEKTSDWLCKNVLNAQSAPVTLLPVGSFLSMLC